MSYRKVSAAVAASVTALALSASAYGDGKSPNGPPGPEGNPNQPAAQPQANGPQGPAGNETQGKQNAAAKPRGKSQAKSHGKSGQSHGKSQQSHGKSQSQPQSKTKNTGSHANPNVGTPRKGGREDRPAGKITICHATKSHTNPYVEITISVNGLHGHGPADDPHHHAGSWKDIIPAPAGGCPTTVTPEQQTGTEKPATTTTTPEQTVATIVAPTPEVAVTAPAAESAPANESAPGQQAVLGARAQGTSPASESAEAPGQSKVLGATASGTAPKAATAAVAESGDSGSLPFTGFGLAFVLLVAAAALLGGFALRRATVGSRS